MYRKYTIYGPVPSCPLCKGMLRHNRTVKYICSSCKAVFEVEGQGVTEHELVCTHRKIEHADWR